MKVLHFKTVPSTNAIAKKYKKAPWTVILADEQVSGYGKGKRFWYSPKGGLYFSIVLPKTKIEDLQILTISSAFIVAKVLKENFSFSPLIKLPNDVLINQRKVCGVLVENVVSKDVKSSVIGIGLNTNIKSFPDNLKNKATSLEIELKRKVPNKKILNQIVNNIRNQL